MLVNRNTHSLAVIEYQRMTTGNKKNRPIRLVRDEILSMEPNKAKRVMKRAAKQLSKAKGIQHTRALNELAEDLYFKSYSEFLCHLKDSTDR